MEIDPWLIRFYIPDTIVVESGKSNPFSSIIGYEPGKKGYGKGVGFFCGGMELSGVFVVDCIPKGHASDMV